MEIEKRTCLGDGDMRRRRRARNSELFLLLLLLIVRPFAVSFKRSDEPLAGCSELSFNVGSEQPEEQTNNGDQRSNGRFGHSTLLLTSKPQKKKSTAGLGGLFKRGGKKDETQALVIVVADKPSGELSFDLTQPCAALRKKLATTKIVFFLARSPSCGLRGRRMCRVFGLPGCAAFRRVV
jgi:hypothetical protein